MTFKMIFKKMFVSFMSATLMFSAISLPMSGSYAAASRVKWRGYANNIGSVNFDTWDGSSFDTFWYFNSAGTQNDPYIIGSASDLTGMSELLTNGSLTTEDERSFSGKYFKLDADLDFTGYVIPQLTSDAGLAADFDLNGHVIRLQSTLFTEIADGGMVHNGTFVSTGENQHREGLSFSTKSVTVINTNRGLVFDINVMSNQVFLYENADDSANIILVSNNYGTVSNSVGYCGLRDSVSMVCSNGETGTIEDCTQVMVACPWSTVTGRYAMSPLSCFIGMNSGLIDGLEISQDSPESDGNTFFIYCSVYQNDGEIKDLNVDDMKIYCTNDFWIVYTNNGEISDFKITNVVFDSDTVSLNNRADANMGVCGNQQGRLIDGTIDITSSAIQSGIIAGSSSGTSFTDGSFLIGESNIYEYPRLYTSQSRSEIDADYDFVSEVINHSDSFIYRCNINIEYLASPNTGFRNGTTPLLFGAYVSCNINITGLANLIYNSGEEYFTGAIVDSDVYLDEAKTVGSQTKGVVFYNNIVKSKVHIGKLIKLPGSNYDKHAFNSVYYSTIVVDEALDYGGDYPGLCVNSFYSDIIVKKAIGHTSDFLSGGFSVNTRYMITYCGNFEFDDGSRQASQNCILDGCEYFISFAADAVGKLNTLFINKKVQPDYLARNSLVYIAPMPKDVFLVNTRLVGTAEKSGFSDFVPNSGMTVIAPKVNVSADAEFGDSSEHCDDGFAILSGCRKTKGSSNAAVPQGCYVYAKLYFEDPSMVDYVTGSQEVQSATENTLNNTFDIGVFDSSGNAADLPVYALMSIDPGAMNIENVSLSTNSTSAKSALMYQDNRTHALYFLTDGSKSLAFRNCVLDLPNISGEEYAGLVYSNKWFDDSQPNSDDFGTMAGILQRLGRGIEIENCFMVGGRPLAYTSDKTFTLLDELNASSENNSFVAGAKLLVSEGCSLESEDDGIVPDIKTYGMNGNISGELAYLLDEGYKGNANRTFEWTVADETFGLLNSMTGEVIYDCFPLKTFKTGNISKYLPADVNLNPVYKAEVSSDPKGYIEIVGVNGVERTQDDKVYAKSGAYIVSDEGVTAEKTAFVGATQSLEGGEPTNIPSTPRVRMESGYTILGYTLPDSDVLLTPLFDDIPDTSEPEISEPAPSDPSTSKPESSQPKPSDSETHDPEQTVSAPEKPNISESESYMPPENFDSGNTPNNPATGANPFTLTIVIAAVVVSVVRKSKLIHK